MINQKPTEYDVHLKYLCPKCSQSHWLSFKEASTKNFKIVCDCDKVFKVRRLESFKVKYFNSTIQDKQDTTIKNKTSGLSNTSLNKCIKVLNDYGFSKHEAKEMICQSHNETQTEDIAILIKAALTKFGAKNVI
jgi:hypothetical protein